MTDLTTHIKTACEIKEQMNRQIASLYDRLGSPDWFATEHQDAARVLTRQYAPAIRAVVDASTTEDLHLRRERLNDRLDQGYDWCNSQPDNLTAAHTWCDLLTEFEVINDALNHIAVVNGTLDRLDWIAALQVPDAPLVQGSLT